jgi:hypothetical protein
MKNKNRLTEEEKRDMFCSSYYDEEKGWFPDSTLRTTNKNAENFFDIILKQNSIKGWSIAWIGIDDGGIAVCDMENHQIIIGNNPRLVTLCHEMGHLLIPENMGHTHIHKIMTLKLYGLFMALVRESII